MKDVRNSHLSQHRRFAGFTLIELLVVISITSLLAAILFPVFARARESARRASCMSNVKQLSMAFIMYSQDYDEHTVAAYYSGTSWPHLLFPYVKSTQVYNCPSDARGVIFNAYDNNVSYGLSNPLRSGLPSGVQAPALADIAQPSETVVFVDTENWQAIPGVTTTQAPNDRHLDTVVVGFCDGHAKAMKKSALEAITTTGENGVPQGDLWRYGGSYILWNRS